MDSLPPPLPHHHPASHKASLSKTKRNRRGSAEGWCKAETLQYLRGHIMSMLSRIFRLHKTIRLRFVSSYKYRLGYSLTSPCPGCFGAVALSTCPSAFSFPTTVMQPHDTHWHIHSACPYAFPYSFCSCRIIRHASASSLSFHDLGRCPWALEHVLGEGHACHVSFMPASLARLP